MGFSCLPWLASSLLPGNRPWAGLRTGRTALREHSPASARQGRSGSGRQLSRDRRPLCVEHLEDLRGKTRTRHELRRLLEHAARRRPVVLTLTCGHGDGEVVRWLATWTDLLTLD